MNTFGLWFIKTGLSVKMISYQNITANQDIVCNFNIVDCRNVDTVHKNYVVTYHYLRVILYAPIRGNRFYPKIIASFKITPHANKFRASYFGFPAD